MSQGSHTYLTPTGFNNLKSKLNQLYKERVALGKEMGYAKEPGREEENSSYSAICDRSMQIETHMEQIHNTLRNAVLIKKPTNKNVVSHGHTVTLKRGSDIKTFTLVGSMEADPSNGRVSDASPVGQQLLKARLGDRVEIGNGKTLSYTILSIE